MSVYPTFAYDPKLGRRARALALKGNPTRVCFCSSVEEGLQGLRKLALDPAAKRAMTKAEKDQQSLQDAWDKTDGFTCTWQEETAEIEALEALVAKGWKVSKGGAWVRSLSGGKSLQLLRYREWNTTGWRLFLVCGRSIELASNATERLESAVKLLSEFEGIFVYA